MDSCQIVLRPFAVGSIRSIPLELLQETAGVNEDFGMISNTFLTKPKELRVPIVRTNFCDGSYQFLRAAGAPLRRRGAVGAPAARKN